MRKIFNYLFLLPLAVVLILLSVANRQSVQFSVDPLNSETPALALDLPLFVFLFAAFLLGMLLGGFLVWMSQGKHRKALREKSFEATKLKKDYETNTNSPTKNRPEIAPGLPVATRN
ncbi:MAG: lipopolysaccharide assembly protein LapA domain-containing protein [Pseudomonadota bacterium]